MVILIKLMLKLVESVTKSLILIRDRFRF